MFRLTTIITALSIGCAVAQAQFDPPLVDESQFTFATRPAYDNDHPYREDWSGLAGLNPHKTGDFWDPIKYIPLSDDASIWASFGGEFRFRVESWRNYRFFAPNDETTLMFRLRLHSDIHFGDNVRFFLEGKSSQITDRDLFPTGKRAIDIVSVDLHQAFGDFTLPLGKDDTLTLRIGRQELAFGVQRLVSPLDLANNRRTFEGVIAILQTPHWRTQGFWTQVVRQRKYEFDHAVNQARFFGIYAQNPQAGLDLYWLGFDRDNAAFNGTTGNEHRHTIGGRLFGQIGETGFDFDIEGAYQFGTIGSNDIDAYFATAQVSTIIQGARVFVGAGYASGDDSPGGDVQTFNSMFPHGYRYLGYMAEIGRQNTIDIHTRLIHNINSWLTAEVLGHVFWLADTDDAHYTAGNTVLEVGADAHYVGSELDLRLLYQIDRHWSGLIGYSHFFVGDHPDESGPTQDGDLFYMNLSYTF